MSKLGGHVAVTQSDLSNLHVSGPNFKQLEVADSHSLERYTLSGCQSDLLERWGEWKASGMTKPAQW